MFAKVANDNACILDKRGAADFFASKLAPTELKVNRRLSESLPKYLAHY